MTSQHRAPIKFSDAERLTTLLLECTGVLNDVAAYMKEHCTNEFRTEVEPIVGSVMADIGWELLERIFKQHPSLRPYVLEKDADPRSQA